MCNFEIAFNVLWLKSLCFSVQWQKDSNFQVWRNKNIVTVILKQANDKIFEYSNSGNELSSQYWNINRNWNKEYRLCHHQLGQQLRLVYVLTFSTIMIVGTEFIKYAAQQVYHQICFVCKSRLANPMMIKAFIFYIFFKKQYEINDFF